MDNITIEFCLKRMANYAWLERTYTSVSNAYMHASGKKMAAKYKSLRLKGYRPFKIVRLPSAKPAFT